MKTGKKYFSIIQTRDQPEAQVVSEGIQEVVPEEVLEVEDKEEIEDNVKRLKIKTRKSNLL